MAPCGRHGNHGCPVVISEERRGPGGQQVTPGSGAGPAVSLLYGVGLGHFSYRIFQTIGRTFFKYINVLQ